MFESIYHWQNGFNWYGSKVRYVGKKTRGSSEREEEDGRKIQEMWKAWNASIFCFYNWIFSREVSQLESVKVEDDRHTAQLTK